jgi:hypothetical protein
LNFRVKHLPQKPFSLALFSFILIFSAPLPFALASSKSPYDSGYDHGCDDAGISDPSEQYINQPEKGPAYHTSEFMDGYYSGLNSCSGDTNEFYSDSEINQNPSNSPNSSQDLNTLIRQFCAEVNNGDYDAAIPIAAMAGLSSYAMAVKGGCAVMGFLDWLDSNS